MIVDLRLIVFTPLSRRFKLCINFSYYLVRNIIFLHNLNVKYVNSNKYEEGFFQSTVHVGS